MPHVGDEFKEHAWIISTCETQDFLYSRHWEDWWRGKETLDSMEAEAKKISSIRKQNGWSEFGHMKRIASMPLDLFHILRQCDPEMFENTKEGRAKFDRFLIRWPYFGVR